MRRIIVFFFDGGGPDVCLAATAAPSGLYERSHCVITSVTATLKQTLFTYVCHCIHLAMYCISQRDCGDVVNFVELEELEVTYLKNVATS